MVYKYIHKPFKLFKLIPSKLCVPRCWSFTALFTSGEKGSLKFFFLKNLVPYHIIFMRNLHKLTDIF